MRLHRFIGSFAISSGTLTITDKELLHQWQKVLRLKVSDQVILGDGNGTETRATIVVLTNSMAELNVLEQYQNTHEPIYAVNLYASIIKRDNFEWLSQKATECGVQNIIPITTERTIKMKLPEERLKKIIGEAAEQSFRAMVPKLYSPLSFKDALKDAKEKSDIIFICTPDKNTSMPQGDLGIQKYSKRAVFIGPEGGFTDAELALAETFGARKLNLGKTVLRAETAAIIAVHNLAN